MENNSSSEEKLHTSKYHVSLEIVEANDHHLTSSIKDKMESICSPPCIFRVPENLSRQKETSFNPEIVSIGPFHRGKESLRASEAHKWRYLHTLLGRKPSLEASLDSCVKALKEVEHRTRNCYEEDINLTSDEFVEMMLLDGCFMIELFLKYGIKGLKPRGDPLFSTTGMFFSLRRDLILLENQIPFFLLQMLFDLVPIPKQCKQSLNELVFRFLKRLIPGDKQVILENFSKEGLHLLDLIHNTLLPTYPTVEQKQNGSPKHLDCATKLQGEGYKFDKSTAESLLEAKFVNGVIEIPPLKINHYTETLLRNLIALEQCYCGTFPVTSYAFFMHNLICSDKDARLLHRRQILTNCFNNEKEVCDMFRNICKEVDLKDFYYGELCQQINEYKRSGLNVWHQKLKPNYHKTPISGIAIFGAISVIVLTIFIGSLFSVLSFSLHHFQ